MRKSNFDRWNRNIFIRIDLISLKNYSRVITIVIMAFRAASARQYGESKIKLDRVSFVGINRTKSDALLLETKNLFLQKTFRDLVVAANESRRHMEKVGLFEKLEVAIVKSESSENALEVQYFDIREPTPKAAINGTMNNRGEAGMSVSGSIGTAFGRGEVLSSEASFGHQHSSSFMLGFSKPLLRIRDAALGLHLFRSFAEFPWTGLCQLEHGVVTAWRYDWNENFHHELKWSGSWRRAECLQRTTSFQVREHSGHSLKSSLINSFRYSTLDSDLLPTKGLAATFSQEIAGLGGDARFIRFDTDFRASAKLPLGLILSLSTSAGYMTPRGRGLNILDRLFLGGPTTIRGFAHNGVGPAVDGAFVGGTASFCSALHVYRPLIPARIVFAHVFATAGNLCTTSKTNRLDEAVRELLVRPRCSLGFGLVFKLSEMARLELNYCFPFTNHVNDRLQPGFQFGIGVSFM